MVVICPWRMPMASWTTFTTGARQFVVQDAAVSRRVGLRCPLVFVDVSALEPMGPGGATTLATHAAQGGPRGQPADPAQPVDADTHAAHARTGMPISSSRAFAAIRSKDANGRLAKISR